MCEIGNFIDHLDHLADSDSLALIIIIYYSILTIIIKEINSHIHCKRQVPGSTGFTDSPATAGYRPGLILMILGMTGDHPDEKKICTC